MYIAKFEIVGMYMFVYLYACSLIDREGINRFVRNLACLFRETRKRTYEGQSSGQSDLNSTPGEGVSCSLETKPDRRTAPRPKLFVSKRRLRIKGSQP
jgi:hypothetical protein